MSTEGQQKESENAIQNKVFDYVIVGAGPSAIGVLRGLLESWSGENGISPGSVVVIERGAATADLSTKVLSNWHPAAHSTASSSVTHFPTEIFGRTMDLPVGQGLGGTSLVNAGFVTPPLPQDMEDWPQRWKECLPHAAEKVYNELHQNGVLHVQKNEPNRIPKPMRNGPVQWFPTVATMESISSETGKYERESYFNGLVAPILRSSPHLKNSVHWMFETEVQRLLLSDDSDQPNVFGVECQNLIDGSITHIQARYSVTLSAGAIETPALLLTSGIGLASGEDLMGVGRHLRDQVSVPMVLFTPWPESFELSTNGIAALGHIFCETDKRAFQVAVADATSFSTIIPYAVAMAVRRRCNTPRFRRLSEFLFGVTRLILWFLFTWSPVRYILQKFTTTIIVFLMHPASEGRVTISTPKTSSQPLRRRDIDVNVSVGYFKEMDDVHLIQNACQAARPRNCLDFVPGMLFPKVALDLVGLDAGLAYCSSFSQPYFHFSGTCSMNCDNSASWVVDSDLRLRGHTGLYLCDLSVFPSQLSSPPALTCCAMGYEHGKSMVLALSNKKRV